MDVRRSICRNCGASCPILVTVDDGRVVQVEGNRAAPLYNGYICPKGRTLPAQQAKPGRLLHSLKRLPDGRHVPITSEQLVEEVAERLARIIDESGPAAVAGYMGGGMQQQWGSLGVLVGFMQAIRSPMMFSNATIDQPGQEIAQALHGGWQGGRTHPADCETFLMVGGNPVASKQHFPQNPVEQLKTLTRGGMRLIVIDPRRTETARRAAVHLQIIPGEDPAVLAGLIHLIFAMDGVDADFLRDNADGVDALREAVRAFTPEAVAARAGIAVDDLVAAARVLVEARTGDAGSGVGPSFATLGTLSAYLVLCIQTLRGFWSRAGDRFSRPPILFPAVDPRAQPAPRHAAWGFGVQTGVRGLQQTVAGMPTAALPELMLSKGEDRIRALFLHSGAVYTWPQRHRTVEALGALDLMVMHDTELTATAAMADYVIATHTQLEVPVSTHLGEGCGVVHPGYAWTEPYAMYQPAALPPPPGSDLMEAWQIYYRVARRLGLEICIGDTSGQPPAPLDMANEPTTDDIFAITCRNAVVPLDRVKAFADGAIFEEARRTVGPREPGCTRRLELADPHMLGELAEVAREDPLARRGTGPDYPYLLVARRVMSSNCSALRSDIAGRQPYNPAYVHPDDLRRLGVATGALVAIASRHGTIQAVVEADGDMRPGVIAMSVGFGARPGTAYDPRRDGANVNDLIDWRDDSDPYHGMPRMGALPIAIRAVEEAVPA